MDAMQRAMGTKVYQDFVPPTELVEEPECDTLLVYVPGYRKEQLRVQLTKTRNLVISGESPVGDNIWRRFQKTIPVSSNCDISRITAKFEDSILYVTQPKLIASAEKQDQEKPTSNHENLTAEKQDQEKTTATKTHESYKRVDENENRNKAKHVSDHKQADNTTVERKETLEQDVKKLSDQENVSKNVEDSHGSKSVLDKISEVVQTKHTAKIQDKGDQKHKTDSGYFMTKLRIRKEVINIVIAILVAIAFGLHVKYSFGSCKKAGKEVE